MEVYDSFSLKKSTFLIASTLPRPLMVVEDLYMYMYVQ